MTFRPYLYLPLSLALACLPLTAQVQSAAQNPSFRSETQLVEVVAVASDSHGRIVTDLRPEELRLFEDGVLRPLTHFTYEHSEKLDALTVQRLHDLAEHKVPGVYANFNEDSTTLPPNGCSVLLIDWLNTPLELQPAAREELKKFVETVELSKPLAVFALDRSVHQIQGFTSDRALLRSQVEKYGLRTANLQPEKRASRSTQSDEIDWRVQSSLSALVTLALNLQGIHGHKSVIWLSGGFPAGIFPTNLTGLTPLMEANLGGYLYGERREYGDLIAQVAHLLATSNIAVYPVDAYGLQTTTADASQFSVRYFLNPIGQNIVQRQQSMREVADLTGGRAFYNHNDIGREIQNAYEDGDAFYALAFRPAKNIPDGRLHAIRLECKRAGVQLRYRRNYFASNISSEASKRAEMEALVRGNLQSANGLPLMAQLDKSDNQRLKLWMDGSVLSFAGLDGDQSLLHLDIAIATYNDHGGLLGQNYALLNIKIKSEHLSSTRKSGVMQTIQFARSAETAELRVAVRDLTTGLVGILAVPLKAAKPAQ